MPRNSRSPGSAIKTIVQPPKNVPTFLRTMHATVTELASGSSAAAEPTDATSGEEFTPAVSVRKSLASKDHIISMIDGKPYKTLRRHLSTHGLTPEEYRARYNLKSDYPMVAPSYAAKRSELAKKLGLGQQRRNAAKSADTSEKVASKAPRKGGRKKAA